MNTFRLLLIAFTLTLPLLATSCKTVEGLGEDTQNLGDGISDTARNVEDAFTGE